MGKTPKKAAPGGDESNLYVRRLKATTTASLKACETSLPARRRESENPNRGKAIGAEKPLPVSTGKVFKSKLRSPAARKSHKPLKNPPRFQPFASKEEKKPTGASTTSKDRDISQVPRMHPESEEAAVQLKVSITKKDVKDGGRMSSVEESSGKEETEASHGNSNGKDAIELAETENTTPRDEKETEGKAADRNAAEKRQTAMEKASESRDNGIESNDTVKNNSRDEESEADNPSSEFGENALKLEDEGESPKPSERNGESQEFASNRRKERDETETRETVREAESKKSAESCSVEVVESTTSEASDSGNATQSDKERESNDEPAKDNPENDASFISYDSSIMLKDVQIKLNDCLKDHSKLFDVSNANEESSGANAAADREKRLEMSFGKTLRNISGRGTINRLRYVTVREHRFSPNSSLFVNTSSLSLDPEDLASCNSLRHRNESSDASSINGSPADRKRKILAESVVSAKKLKTETTGRTSILDASLELLKGIRRPIQVSTPDKKGYQFSTDKYSAKSFGDDKLTVDARVEPKKWCVVM